jgi:hypothetical protein
MAQQKLLALFVVLSTCAGCHAADAAAPTTVPSAKTQAAADDPVPIQAPTTRPVEQHAKLASLEQSASAAPTTKPSFASELDRQLRRLLDHEPAESMQELPADERNLIATVIDGLAAFRRAASDEGSLLASKSAPLAELSQRIRDTQPLEIPTLAVCRGVTQFGVYDPFEPARFTAGTDTPIIVYCEIDNFLSRATSDARWETKLSYEAVLYADNEAGVSVVSKKPTSIVDKCRNRRHDFFLADRMTIPGTLPVGKYLLKVTIIDQLANHVAEKSIPVMVAVN